MTYPEGYVRAAQEHRRTLSTEERRLQALEKIADELTAIHFELANLRGIVQTRSDPGPSR